MHFNYNLVSVLLAEVEGVGIFNLVEELWNWVSTLELVVLKGKGRMENGGECLWR